VAVPTIAADTLPVLKKECDELVYLDAPQWFGSVGAFYETFAQTEDGEVIELMKKNS